MYHPICGFEHLHRHSDFSLLDGFATVEEYSMRMKQINQQFLCISDHGVMGSVPSQVKWCEINRQYPIFACELYVNPMQIEAKTRAESAELRKSLGDGSKEATPMQKKFDKSCHLLAIAYTNQGYSNLVRLTSWAWIHGYYRRPRVNHDVLQRYKEGIIFTSTCGNSEIAHALFTEGEEAAEKMLLHYLAMFGKEHFKIELMMLDWKQQPIYNAFLIKMADKYGLEIHLSQDCHYCLKEHSHNQRLQLMQQNHVTIHQVQAMIDAGESDDLFVLQDQQLYLKSEDDVNNYWENSSYKENIDYEIFKQAKANTVKICQQAKGVEIDRELKLPKIPDAEAILMEEIEKGMKARHCPENDRYKSRIQEEYELICSKGFASYFLIQKMMTDEAREAGPRILGFGDGSEAVGPGRGSVCGSLVAYALRLHDVEPIIHDLRFSRFLSPARGGVQMKVRHSINPIPHEEVKL